MEEEEITIPEGMNVSFDGRTLTVTGKMGTLTRVISIPSISIKVENRTVKVLTSSRRKRDVAALRTVKSHIQNMAKGVEKGFEYELKIFYAHFPMNVAVEGSRVKITNFLGEKYPRYAQIVGDVRVTVKGDIITVSGIDKETVGQTAANLEQATRIVKRDPRVFQDGIYLFQRDGVKLK